MVRLCIALNVKAEVPDAAVDQTVLRDGHYLWLKELHSSLRFDTKRIFPIPKDIEWHTEEHTIWMLLVGMFGDWGTSIRGGWIDKPSECAEFIEELCKECWVEYDGK